MSPFQNGLLIMIFRKNLQSCSITVTSYSMTVPTQNNLELLQDHPRSIRVKYIKNVMHFFDTVYLVNLI